jgi:hypothetical protein
MASEPAPEEQGRNRGGVPPAEHRFQPGQSGNPGGRPKGRSLTDRLRAAVEQAELSGRTLPRPIADLLIDAMLTRALKGDSAMIREVLDRIDGKVPLAVTAEHSGPGGGPIEIAARSIDLSTLDQTELEALGEIARKLALEAEGSPGNGAAGTGPAQPD